MTVYLLEMRNISKSFPGVMALDDVSITLFFGRDYTSWSGENGAGKSTLIKTLSGVYPAGSFGGEILIDGRSRSFSGRGRLEAAESLLSIRSFHWLRNFP